MQSTHKLLVTYLRVINVSHVQKKMWDCYKLGGICSDIKIKTLCQTNMARVGNWGRHHTCENVTKSCHFSIKGLVAGELLNCLNY